MRSSNKIIILFFINSCKRSGPTQILLNIIAHIDREIFEPYLITLYKEDETSRLNEFLPIIENHLFVETSKLQILTGTDRKLREAVETLNPDIIHSHGAFSDYAVSRIAFNNHIITSHNFVYDDYPAKYGALKGNVLAKIHLCAMRNARVICCSKSLSEIYRKKLGLEFGYICNGVETDKFFPAPDGEKIAIRTELNIPADAFVFIYTGSFIPRKNVSFLLEVFSKRFKEISEKVFLLLVGGGVQLKELKEKYKKQRTILFTGPVRNVERYLWAADIYISASKSEGMPCGVLEAMATGLPVILSDIPQHRELFETNENIGQMFRLGEEKDCLEQIVKLLNESLEQMSAEALKCVKTCYDARSMSQKYQAEYLKICEKHRQNQA